MKYLVSLLAALAICVPAQAKTRSCLSMQRTFLSVAAVTGGQFTRVYEDLKHGAWVWEFVNEDDELIQIVITEKQLLSAYRMIGYCEYSDQTYYMYMRILKKA
jgi:hypothetical protein